MDIQIESPIFIVGVGRSGTTLIQSMLNAHQDIAFTPETHFVRKFFCNQTIIKEVKDNNIDLLKHKIIKDEHLNRLDFDLESIFKKLIKEDEFTLKKFYNTILNKYLRDKNKKIVGEKDPKNTEFLPVIKKLYPNSYIIHIIRDPRDVVLSRMEANWSKDRYFLSHLLAYREQIKKGINEGRKLFDNHYFEFHYEDLIENPEKVLHRITNFLDIEYDQNMLYFNKKSKEIVKGEEKQWKKNCFKPVISSNKNKWKDKLTKYQVLMIESVCNIAFEKYKYSYSNYRKEMKFHEKLFYIMVNKLMVIIDIVYNLMDNCRLAKLDIGSKNILSKNE